jgi:hypothetical protein
MYLENHISRPQKVSTRNTKPTQDTNNQEAVHPMAHRAAAIQKNRKRGQCITPN